MFNVAVVGEGTVNPATMDNYRTMFVQRARAHPRHWPICFLAEQRARQERALDIRRAQEILHQRSPQFSTFDPEMPWNSVLAELSNDNDWWRQNINDVVLAEGAEAAATRNEAYSDLKRPAANNAASYGEEEWRPNKFQKGKGKGANGKGGAGKGKNGKNGKGGGKGNAAKGGKGEKNPDGTYRLARSGGEICRSWCEGGCEPQCPFGRVHCCQICRGNHRTINHKAAAAGTISDS